MLCEIMRILEQEKTVLPHDIAARLGVSDESMRSALEQLVRIGALRVTTQSAERSGGCENCRGCKGKTIPTSCPVTAGGNEIKWYEPI